ncbi:non-homologous end-joining DNA ligase [Marivirga sp. S37H4]|uniref:Non-homologous end-joining DNA ligase n=1 Tax=Marivirga aurantiaca TaxID=2802615 RepID=A0A935C7K2_9BACT|nr:non-homologous end-joining DNA ligase [Marivirga aurantiaca]MBK6264970.1 non-homologous end-joining DNA ligase [Marivirga aurantiaca]
MDLKVGRYIVGVTNQNKLLFPKAGISKIDLIEYYLAMAEHIIPYTKDRPVTMHRFPDGIGGKSFYQKEASDYFPDWLDTVKVPKEDGEIEMVMINKKASLTYLANQGCITPHIWLSKKDKIDYPDKLVFDLDPSDNDFNVVIQAAKDFRKLLEDELDLKTFIMTTGSKGLHIIVPIIRNKNFDEVREFASGVCKIIANDKPDDYTTEIRKDKRKGRLFLDYMRNSYAQTSVMPYAVRALEGAPVATPLFWKELQGKMNAQRYTLSNIQKRIENEENPWENYYKSRKSLSKPMQILEKMLNR